jgi:hypothetical protein
MCKSTSKTTSSQTISSLYSNTWGARLPDVATVFQRKGVIDDHKLGNIQNSNWNILHTFPFTYSTVSQHGCFRESICIGDITKRVNTKQVDGWLLFKKKNLCLKICSLYRTPLYTITKENFQSFSFFSLLITLVDFSVGTTDDGTTNIQKIFKLCPHVLRHSILYVGFCWNSWFLTRYIRLFTYGMLCLQSYGVKSGDLRCQAIGVSLPNHAPGIM